MSGVAEWTACESDVLLMLLLPLLVLCCQLFTVEFRVCINALSASRLHLCSTTSDLECSALSSTTRPADTNPCFGCQQGRLLLFWAFHTASPRPSLVAGPGTDSIPSLRSGIPMSQWISVAISCWERSSDSRCGRSSLPPLFYHHDACCPVRQCSDQLLVTVPLLSLHRGHGTAYHLPSELFHPSLPFSNNYKTHLFRLSFA